VGFSFSKIRPKGDTVRTTSGNASGPVALMAILDHASDIFMQAGGRRSGNMVTLAADHPDIFEFIACKESGANLPHINYSIEASDAFMKAVADDEDWDLVNPRTGETVQTVPARSVMDQIVRMAWRTGDPGLIFIDEINRYNPTPHVGRLNTVNLCGEQPLLSYEACNLGSINLAAHLVPVKGKQSTVGDFEIDWDALAESTRVGVRMLDNVISVCTYPIKKIDEVVKGNRKIGLGVMGWADMLLRLGIAINEEKAFRLAAKVMKFVRDRAWEESEKLGRERGNFPNFKGSIWEKRGYNNFRNATVTTIAPTGSLSMAAGCSSGIEPHFALAYYRKAMGQYELPEVNQDLVTALKRENRVYSEELMTKVAGSGSIQQVDSIPEKLKRVFVTSMDIMPEDHVRMQAQFQRFTDNAVSKTINLPVSASTDEVMEAYMLAWELKCKGITVYRDKSREVQVLNVGHERDGKKLPTSVGSNKVKDPSMALTRTEPRHVQDESMRTSSLRMLSNKGEVCPECGGKLTIEEGCSTCHSCGYSACSV
jgi:ribonucleoside-diphosphate reductase alpha chain